MTPTQTPQIKVSRKAVQVVPYASTTGTRQPYYVSLEQAEILVARGSARWFNDGTRRVYEIKTAARGESRSWRKVTNRSTNGAALYSSIQLVPGVSQGRNTGSRTGRGTGRVG